MKRFRLTIDRNELDLLLEAVNYHYLTDLSYSMPYEELGEVEQEDHDGLMNLRRKLQAKKDHAR